MYEYQVSDLLAGTILKDYVWPCLRLCDVFTETTFILVCHVQGAVLQQQELIFFLFLFSAVVVVVVLHLITLLHRDACKYSPT